MCLVIHFATRFVLHHHCAYRVLDVAVDEAGAEADLSSRLPDWERADHVDGETWHRHRRQHTGTHQQHLWEELRVDRQWQATSTDQPWHCPRARIPQGATPLPPFPSPLSSLSSVWTLIFGLKMFLLCSEACPCLCVWVHLCVMRLVWFDGPYCVSHYGLCGEVCGELQFHNKLQWKTDSEYGIGQPDSKKQYRKTRQKKTGWKNQTAKTG